MAKESNGTLDSGRRRGRPRILYGKERNAASNQWTGIDSGVLTGYQFGTQ